MVGVWSSGGDLATARYALAGCGTQTAGLSFGGNNGLNLTVTEEYNGTSWSAGGALLAVIQNPGGCGSQAAGLSFGGQNGGYSVATEEYDPAPGWTGKINGISSPLKINGIAVTNIAKVMGV